MALKNVIKDSEKEEKSKVDVIEVIFEQHVHLGLFFEFFLAHEHMIIDQSV